MVISAPRSIILDTNVWSRVAEAGAGRALRSAAHKSQIQVVAAPSVLYELARTPVPETRRRAVRLITEAHWRRLMPEAYLEAEEIIAAIGRHHPEWLVDNPQVRDYERLVYDWARRNNPAKRRLRSANKAGVWERFRLAPDDAAAQLTDLEGSDLDLARSEAKAARREMLEQDEKAPGPLHGVMAMYKAPRPGWRGDAFAFWRGETLESLTHYLLARSDGAYFDWISPFIRLPLLHRQLAAWARFWLYEVEAGEVPRQWIRWAFRYLARFRRISSGTPCDIQLAAYLPDADYLASADKLMIELVQECGKYSPVPLAKGVRVAGKPDTVESLLDALAALGA